MKRSALVMAALLIAAPAHAQFSMGGGNDSGGTRTRYTEEEKRAEQQTERAYRDAVRNTRGQVNEAYDPWRNIRQTAPEKNQKPQR